MIHEGSGHFQRLIKEHLPQAQRILVVGCGRSGKEVVDLAHALPAYIEGFDVELDPEVNDLKTERYHIQLGDACAMGYPDSVFDAIFYHHVIEHVPDPQRSIVECARVLREGGYLYCGTPNRTRLMGYIGARASLAEKMRWNLADWKMRLQGRFRNEYGAHAGFTEAELDAMIRPHFREVTWLTSDYLWFKYGRRLPSVLLRLICWRPIRAVLAPAVYCWARK